MSIVSISRIQHRRGLQQDLPNLATAELGWSIDTRKLYIGNGTIEEGAPTEGRTEILTEHSEIGAVTDYTFKGNSFGFQPQTGLNFGSPTVRPLQDKLDDYVSIKDFGAIGDGLTDDTQAINRALRELYSRSTSPQTRKTLFFPAGNYNIKSSIKLPPNTSIRGEGANNSVITRTGSILGFSNDAESWEFLDAASTITLYCVLQTTNGTRIAGGPNGTIYTSTDGITWNAIRTESSGDILSIARSGTNIVAVGSNSSVIFSSDSGNTWRTANNANIVSTDFFTVIASGSYFYFAGSNGKVFRGSITSTTQMAIEESFEPLGSEQNVNSLLVSNGFLYAFANRGKIERILLTKFFTSSWNETLSLTTAADLYAAAIGSSESLIVVVGSNSTVLTSTDGGTNWSVIPLSTTEIFSFRDIIFSQPEGSLSSIFVAVGDRGNIFTSANPFLPSPTPWVSQDSDISTDIRKIFRLSDGFYFLSSDNSGFVLETSDSRQQTNLNIGSNGALPPTDILITDIGFKQTGDESLLLLSRARNIKFDNCNFSGSVTQLSTSSPLQSVVKIASTPVMTTSNVIFESCKFSNSNYAALLEGDMEDILFYSCKFISLNKGIKISPSQNSSYSSSPRSIKILNCFFDQIYDTGLEVDSGVTSVISAYNYFSDVGNHLLGSGEPRNHVIIFNDGGNTSWGDGFARMTITENAQRIQQYGHSVISMDAGVVNYGIKSQVSGYGFQYAPSTTPQDVITRQGTPLEFDSNLIDSVVVEYRLLKENVEIGTTLGSIVRTGTIKASFVSQNQVSMIDESTSTSYDGIEINAEVSSGKLSFKIIDFYQGNTSGTQNFFSYAVKYFR